MKSIQHVTVAVAVLAGLGAGFAWAADGGKVTRAEVKKEYFDARAAGTLPQPGDTLGQIPKDKAAVARARGEVKKEYFDARAAGALPKPGDVVGEPMVDKSMKARPRGDVRAEARSATRAGEFLNRGDGAR